MRKELYWLLAIIGLVLVIFVFAAFRNTESEMMSNVEAVTVEPKYWVVSDNVNYHDEVNGYLAKPSEEGNYPGVVMIHEWWGLNDNIKQMADELASQGYIVLAVDLYDGEIASESSRAGELAGSVRDNPDEAIMNMRSAIDYLRNEEASKIASLGWCFGGGQSLQISLNEEVDATVIYYGNLITDESELEELDNPVLGIFGSEDRSIPVETVNEFDEALDRIGVENEIYIYDGVGHAFANPSGTNYAAQETEDAWMKTLDFLEKNLN